MVLHEPLSFLGRAAKNHSSRRYNVETYRRFGTVFSYMPVAAIVGGKIFCVHGGISPSLRSLDQIRNIPRPAFVPKQGLLTDLLWADPDPRIEGYAFNKERGVSIVFGPNEVNIFPSLAAKRSKFRPRSALSVCRQHSGALTELNNSCFEGEGLPETVRHGPHMSRSPTVCTGLPILRRREAYDFILGPELLWTIR